MLPGFYFDEDTNRYYKIADGYKAKKRKLEDTPILVQNQYTIENYIYNRRFKRLYRPQLEPTQSYEFNYTVEHSVFIANELYFTQGCLIFNLSNGFVNNVGELPAKISDIASYNDMLYCSTLGDFNAGSVYKYLRDHNGVWKQNGLLQLRKGSIFSICVNHCNIIVCSEKFVYVYTTDLVFRRKIKVYSDVLDSCNYNEHFMMSCRNGTLYLLDNQSLRYHKVYQCDSFAKLFFSNSCLFATTNNVFLKFKSLNMVYEYNRVLNTIHCINNMLIDSNTSNSIVYDCYTMDITYILQNCSQFIPLPTGYILNKHIYCYPNIILLLTSNTRYVV